MAFAGPNEPATSYTQSPGVLWTDVPSAIGEDDVAAVVDLLTNEQSSYLYLYDFGFNIPADAVINGISVDVNDLSEYGSAFTEVYLQSAYTTEGVPFTAQPTPGWQELGGPIDKWEADGFLSDPTVVNDELFGVAIQTNATGDGPGGSGVDAVRMTIFYTPTDPPQEVAPVDTLSAGSWAAVGAPTLDQATDDGVPGGAGDSDYAESPVATSGGHEMKMRVDGVVDPGVSTGHFVRFRYAKNILGGDQVNLIVNLYRADGTTLVATTTITNIGSITLGSLALTGTEADSIPSADYMTGLVLGFKEVKP